MRITYRTLASLIALMNDEQKDSDVTVEIPTEGNSECYSAELRLAGEDHDGGLDDGHPLFYVHSLSDDEQVRVSNAAAVAIELGLY